MRLETRHSQNKEKHTIGHGFILSAMGPITYGMLFKLQDMGGQKSGHCQDTAGNRRMAVELCQIRLGLQRNGLFGRSTSPDLFGSTGVQVQCSSTVSAGISPVQ